MQYETFLHNDPIINELRYTKLRHRLIGFGQPRRDDVGVFAFNLYMNFRKHKLRVFEGFAGYGGASFALRRLKKINPDFDYEVVGYSEIDKFANVLFDANHRASDGSVIKNWGDITQIDPNELPDFDLFTGGFPCQPFSSAGMMKGEDDPYGRGTLFQHIMRICAVKKPKYILMENVKGLKSKKFDATRALMLEILRQIGYP